ncbi:MAG: hypothetical protein ACPGJV_11770 [Bacteriovoracaceae bacterium]
MVDIHTIIHDHRTKRKIKKSDANEENRKLGPSTSEIPDLFFDEILVKFRLSRVEIMMLMFLYRRVWCRPNLYKVYGISPLMSLKEIEATLKLNFEEIYNALRKLEGFGFISTIRSGQYFVRKYFTKDNDESFGQDYDDFEI